jgi:hypothetical protein
MGRWFLQLWLFLLALWAIAHLYPLLYVFLAFTLAAALDPAVRFLNRLLPYPSAVIAAYLAVFGLLYVVQPRAQGEVPALPAGRALPEEGVQGLRHLAAVVGLPLVGPQGQAALVDVKDVPEAVQGGAGLLPVRPEPQEVGATAVGLQIGPVALEARRAGRVAKKPFPKALQGLQVGLRRQEEVEALLLGVAGPFRQLQTLAHVLHAPEEGPEGLGQRLGLQVLGHPLAVDHGLSVLKGPAEDGLQAHPPVRGEKGGFQLVQVEVLEVGGEAPFPFLHGPLRAEETWPFYRSLHGSLPSKNPYRKSGRSHQPEAGG